MKHVLLSLALFASVAVFADEIESSNVIGVLPVTSSAKRTIVSVPWCAMSATDNAAIQVSNIVKTANLTVDDTIHYFDGTAFQTWKLAADATTGIKYWQSVNQVSADGVVTETPSSAELAVARGAAIMLIRNGDLTQPFYLYGQVGSGEVTTEITARGTSESPVYTLVAPCATTNVNLCASGILQNAVDGDEINVIKESGASTSYTRKDDAWKRYKYADGSWQWVAAESVTVPKGMGFWYVSKSNSGSNPVFNW